MQYSDGFRARLIQRMAGPEGISATRLAEETGVCQSTLSRWLREASKRGEKVKSDTAARGARSVRPDDLPPAEKFRLVSEAAKLEEEELGAFLRRHGLHHAQLEQWRQKIEEASLAALEGPKKARRRKSPEAERIQELERELNRKDKALAEVTALLALKKKLVAIWGDEDDHTTPRNGR